jgi:hypothetical protein
MILSDLINRIQAMYSKGVPSDDTRLSQRHIYSKIKTIRARLVSQDANKKQKISAWSYQTIDCIELIPVPTHQCPCLPNIGCEILRSKYPIPAPLTNNSYDLIKSVTTVDRSMKIDMINVNAYNSQKGSKYTSKKTNYFIEGAYLYISTPSNLRVVSMTAVWEDPFEVEKFKTWCECSDCVNCMDYTSFDFPVDFDIADTLVEMCAQELVAIFKESSEDLHNNSRDNIKELGK